MRLTMVRVAAATAAASMLAACATTLPPPPAPMSAPFQSPTRPSPPVGETVSPPGPARQDAPVGAGFASLPGWALDDHVAALSAFRAGCAAVRDRSLLNACRQAFALGPVDETVARQFLEATFRPEPVPTVGLLTAYFAPTYDARTAPDPEFSAPVRPRPPDLGVAAAPYPDRAAIGHRPTDDALAWMRPEDLFFLQIQGSGALVFPDGARLVAKSDGTNGAPFVGLAKPMRTAGLLADDNTSAESIRQWLAAHRGVEAQTLMDLDPRYVFFRLLSDDGLDPRGAAGIPLIPGRSIAVDPGCHGLGELMWIDATTPSLTGAVQVYRRLAVAMDTGGAIKGDARADIYLGRGPAAGIEAGRVRHQLHLYRLMPIQRQGS